MTVDDYWARVKALGLRGAQKGHKGSNYIATTRDGHATSVPDPDPLTPDEREAVIELLKRRHGMMN